MTREIICQTNDDQLVLLAALDGEIYCPCSVRPKPNNFNCSCSNNIPEGPNHTGRAFHYVPCTSFHLDVFALLAIDIIVTRTFLPPGIVYESA